jgi:hypothetical protein
VEEIKDDLGLRSDDRAGMMGRLQAQGVNASSISVTGSAGDTTNVLPRYYRGNKSLSSTVVRPSTAPAAAPSSSSLSTTTSSKASYNAYNIGGNEKKEVQKSRRIFAQTSQISLT